MILKSAKFNPKTAEFKLYNENINQVRQNIALALLIGGYNPLRKYSPNETPINLKTLEILKDKLEDLLNQTTEEMNIHLYDVEKI